MLHDVAGAGEARKSVPEVASYQHPVVQGRR